MSDIKLKNNKQIAQNFLAMIKKEAIRNNYSQEGVHYQLGYLMSFIEHQMSDIPDAIEIMQERVDQYSLKDKEFFVDLSSI